MNNDTAVSLLVASPVIALVCVPVMAANVTYPQEYYTLSERSSDLTIRADSVSWDEMWAGAATAKYTMITVLELRRQTILMEKQNELLAEQNELMGRLVNATEIKFECKATGYVTEPTHFNVDDIEVSPSFNASDYHYDINPADVVPCANLSYFERANYGCPL